MAEDFISAAEASAKRTSEIQKTISNISPQYYETSPKAIEEISRMTSEELIRGQEWQAGREIRPLVNARPGTSGKILESGSFLTAHDLKGVGHTGGLVDELDLVESRIAAETEQGLPFYNVRAGESDPISGLRPVSGENIPKNLSEIRPNELKKIHGENIPIMHPYAYGQTVEKQYEGFQAFGQKGSKMPGERIILRPEVAERTKITAGDYLSNQNHTIRLSEISDSKKAATLANRSGIGKYETMTLGVQMQDIQAMIVRPEHISVNDLSDSLKRISSMNTVHGESIDVGRMIHQSEQRAAASKHGIDYVQDIRLFNTEMHNPAMTQKFIEMKNLSNVSMDSLPKGSTPIQAYLTSIKRSIDSGESSIPGLAGMAETDRSFVSKIIQSHLDQYGKNTKTAVEFANGTMQYDLEGRSYFLHHSKTPDINVGEKIRTTQVGRQVTAGDAIAGHSYGWDARTGIRDAVANQVSNRGNMSKVGDGLMDTLDGVSGPRDYSVYLTSANTADVYPDINVPGTAARAIKGEQEVLDRVSIPANLSDEQAENLVRQMMRKHGVFETTDKAVKSSIDNAVLATKGEEALGNFLEGHGEGVIRGHIKNINQQIASGGRKGIYSDAVANSATSRVKYLGQLGNVVEQSGEEAAFAFAKASFTPQALGLDTGSLSAQITSKGAGTTQAMVDKAVKAQDLILSARSKSSIFGVARDASAAVAAGTKNSNMLRMVGADKAVFKSRF